MMPKKLIRCNSTIPTNNLSHKRMHVGKVAGVDLFANFAIIEGTSHMIRGAVMNGLLYDDDVFDELANQLMTSNARIPAPLSHPSDEHGNFMDANDPLTFAGHNVHAFDTDWRVDNDRLVSNTYINLDMARNVKHADWLMDRIDNKKPIDRSTGLFLNIDDQASGIGTDGEPFNGKVTKIFELNHSAILNPDIEPGAKNNAEGIGMFTNSHGDKFDVEEFDLVTNTSTPAMNLPLAPVDHTWDASAAVERVRIFTKSTDKPSTNYRRFFLAFDQDDAENFGAYKLPFVDIIDGKPAAVKAAIDNAKARLDQTQISDDDKAAALSAIEKYQAKFDNAEPKANVLSKAWNMIKSIFTNSDHELSHDQIEDKIFKKLNEGRSDDQRHLWPVGVFDDNFIYHAESDKLFRQSYALIDDEVVFIGERTEVERVVEYKTVINNNGDSTMLDRKQVIALLESKNISVNADISDDDLKAKLTEAMNTKADPDQAPVGITLEEVTTAVNAAIKPLQDQLNAASDKEQGELAGKVVALEIGIDEEAAKAMSVNSLKAILAKNGTPAFNSAGHQRLNSKDSCSSLTLPNSKEA